MGKHSDPKPSWSANARTLIRNVAAGDRKHAGRHSQEPSTATGVLKSVRRRPMVAAIALPAAATTAIVASSFAFAPTDTASVVTAEEQAATASADPGAQDVPTKDAEEREKEREAAAEEYRKSLEDDPKYNQKPEVKAALPAPEPPKESASSETSGGESSDRGSKSSRSDSRGSSSISTEPCSVSTEIEPKLTANAKKGYRAVCAEFPEVKTFGGPRNDPGSDHHTGQALDIMITDPTGQQITEFAIKHASELGVKYVIYKQKIYAPYTGWEGRAMEDRGSATANHMDHVHVSFN